MFGQALKRAVVATGVAGALLAGLAVSSASATPISFTWNPSGSVPPLSTAPSFTADSFTLGDFAHIHIASNGSFTEDGFIKVKAFQLGPTNVTTPGLNSVAGATAYQLYFHFTATGSLTNFPTCAGTGTKICGGSFSTLTYSMFGDVGGLANFGFVGTTPVVSPPGTPVLLATGSLFDSCSLCSNDVTLNFHSSATHPIPSAAVSATFNPAAGQSGFFVAPLITLDIESAFTNTAGVTTTTSCGTACFDILLNNGGGNGDFFAVPEPGSLLLLGTGLLGLAGFRRKRARA